MMNSSRENLLEDLSMSMRFDNILEDIELNSMSMSKLKSVNNQD